MSIIVTHINENGIVHAADSNLTDENGAHGGTAKKVFEIPGREAGLAIAGTYGVGTQEMDVWLSDFLASDSSTTLTDFAEALCSAINSEATPDQLGSGYCFHIAGYQDSADGVHPEFHHVTNYDINANGDYEVNIVTLHRSEDFWSAYGGRPLNAVFADRSGQIYCNAFPSGRQVYFGLLTRMAELRGQVWSNPNWSFRPPNSVDEEAEVLRLDMEHINLFFRQSNYSAPIIGGPIDTLAIPSP
jgi:hypothetical protein